MSDGRSAEWLLSHQNDMKRTSTTAPTMSTWCGEAAAEVAETTVGTAAVETEGLTEAAETGTTAMGATAAAA